MCKISKKCAIIFLIGIMFFSGIFSKGVYATVDMENIIGQVLTQAQRQKNDYWIKKISSQDYHNIHLAIMVEPYLSMIFCKKKTIESRFSQKKIKPYNSVWIGDIVVLKKSGGPIFGVFDVSDINYCKFSTESEVLEIKEQYNDKIRANDMFWNAKKSISKYATLMGIANVFKLRTPISLSCKNRQSWIVFER